MDLKNHKFLENQRYGVVGSVIEDYPNLLTQQSMLLTDIKFNVGFKPWKYLDVEKYKYLIVGLMHSREEYIFEKQNWIEGGVNTISKELMDYMTTNLKDLVIVRGAGVPITCSKIRIMFQVSVGCREVESSLLPSHEGSTNHMLSLSNCAEVYGSYQFKSWQAGKPTPGG